MLMYMWMVRDPFSRPLSISEKALNVLLNISGYVNAAARLA